MQKTLAHLLIMPDRAAMRADMTQNLMDLGRVRSILSDGRASCAVVIH